MDSFADIRPYNDDEVRPVLDGLLADDELFSTIGRLRYGVWYSAFGLALKPLLRAVLRREVAGVHDVRSFQDVVKKYMDRMIERTTRGFTVSGIDALEPGRPYLFISNHRDISLDPAFVNYSLYHNGHDTVRIAIGDNLLSRPFATDLMRLNRSFIVKRSAKGPRQMFAAYRHLSAYIRHSLEQDRCSVWIAQREGRAKDGVDRTEPAIIKMIAMAHDKSAESFAGYLRSLQIVPVSISYEYDPCDGLKARELAARAAGEAYTKAENEDLRSIGMGIAGDKGAVHVAYGRPLASGLDSADEVAQALDAQIIANYRLHSTNLAAWRELEGADADLPPALAAAEQRGTAGERQRFTARIQALPAEHRPHALALYANPVRSRLRLDAGDAD